MKFTELNLHQDLLRGLKEAGFITCTPVQERTLDHSLKKRDVLVQSQTGTGKTAAFLITIFNLYLESKTKSKKALIIVPTRELALQVEKDAKQLGKYCNLKTGSFFGGMGYVKQEKLIKEGLSLYIGTPGRLIDFYKQHLLDLSKFDILVIDEADRLFDMGFIPDIRYMLKRMVPPSERLTMLYSATLSSRVKQLSWEHMNEPVEIEINPEHVTVDTIEQQLYHVSSEEKFSLLLGILRKEKPRSALIFTNTRRMAEEVSRRLSGNGIKNDYISGDLPQKKRLQIIDSIKSGKTEMLVATDVAARGLHIEELDMVINYDLPDDYQNYVHRIGRTARAGKSGRAVSLACERFVYNLEAIENFIGIKIPVAWAYEDILLKDESPRRRTKERNEERPKKYAAKSRETRQHEKQTGFPGNTGKKKEKKRKGEKHYRQGAPTSPQQDLPVKEKPASPQIQAKQKPANDATLEERLEYYRKKYGEDFVYTNINEELASVTKKRKTPAVQSPVTKTPLLKKLVSLFKKTGG